MYSYILSFCFILLLGCHVSYGQEECGVNEVRAECVNVCNTCKPTGRICNLACVPGCTCLPDHSRDENGVCIPRRLCNVSSSEPKATDLTIPTSSFCTNITACKQFCRRRGYTNGICSQYERRRCQCVGPKATSDPNDSSAAGVNNNNRGCPNTQRCVRSCQERGFSGGNCFGPGFRRCRCYKSGAGEDFNPPITGEEFDGGLCPILSRCIRSCRSRGLPGGTCIGTRRQICRCSRTRTDNPVTFPHGRDVGRPHGREGGTDCSFGRRCENFCVREGFSHGSCAGRNLCKCYKILIPTPAIVEPPILYSSGEEVESGSCQNGSRCSRSCVRRGYLGGVCVGRERRICRCIIEEEDQIRWV